MNKKKEITAMFFETQLCMKRVSKIYAFIDHLFLIIYLKKKKKIHRHYKREKIFLVYIKNKSKLKIYNDVNGVFSSVSCAVLSVSSLSIDTYILAIIGKSPCVVSLSLVLCVEYLG